MLEVNSQNLAGHLIRISELFSEFSGEIIEGLGGTIARQLGSEYFLIHTANNVAMRESDAAKFVRWNFPVHHSWPCNPEKMDGFIEKAAQALFRKFGNCGPQALFVGPLDPGNSSRYYKPLASNLRGRVLQMFPPAVATFKEVESQRPDVPTLFCLVGKEGLFCGMQSPKDCNGFYPGGTKYIRQGTPDTISRAGAKIAEALHYLRLYREAPVAGSHWLEIGACPGGMTSELLERDYQVTAIDRAPLDQRLNRRKGLQFILGDVTEYAPKRGVIFDSILSDMNGDAGDAIRQVARLAGHLKADGLVVFTLKTSGAVSFLEINRLFHEVIQIAASAGLRLFAKTHLTYNRLEFTLFFEKSSDCLKQ